MSYLTQMAGLAVQNFVSAARRDGGARGGHPRHRPPLDERRSATSGATSTGRSSTSCCRSRSSSRVILISQGVPQTFQGTRRRRRCRARTRRSRAAPYASQDRDQAARHERRRRLQLELGRAVREPERVDELPRAARDPAHSRRRRSSCSGRWSTRARHAWMVFAAMFAMFAIGVAVNLPVGAARLAGAAQLRREHHAGPRSERRQHGRQGSPVRDRQHRDLDGRDERRVERLGERRLRRADARPAEPCRS